MCFCACTALPAYALSLLLPECVTQGSGWRARERFVRTARSAGERVSRRRGERAARMLCGYVLLLCIYFLYINVRVRDERAQRFTCTCRSMPLVRPLPRFPRLSPTIYVLHERSVPHRTLSARFARLAPGQEKVGTKFTISRAPNTLTPNTLIKQIAPHPFESVYLHEKRASDAATAATAMVAASARRGAAHCCASIRFIENGIVSGRRAPNRYISALVLLRLSPHSPLAVYIARERGGTMCAAHRCRCDPSRVLYGISIVASFLSAALMGGKKHTFDVVCLRETAYYSDL